VLVCLDDVSACLLTFNVTSHFYSMFNGSNLSFLTLMFQIKVARLTITGLLVFVCEIKTKLELVGVLWPLLEP
jgi:hypothetical protein